MGRKVETVLIQHPGNPAIPLRINLSDYKRDTMTLWVEPSEEPTVIEVPEPVELTDWKALYEKEGWRGVKESAEAIDYEKPDDKGWGEVLDDILEWEGLLKNG